jgi:hypothetical protein
MHSEAKKKLFRLALSECGDFGAFLTAPKVVTLFAIVEKGRKIETKRVEKTIECQKEVGGLFC